MYAICLNFKHIYLYCAPAFGFFYVRKMLIKAKGSQRIVNFLMLASVTIFIFALSFGPILVSESMKLEDM